MPIEITYTTKINGKVLHFMLQQGALYTIIEATFLRKGVAFTFSLLSPLLLQRQVEEKRRS
jgi:hypothetical protein